MSQVFTPPTGVITNVEYLYNEETKRYQIYYREDMGNSEIKIATPNDPKVSMFFPSIYVEEEYIKDAKSNRMRAFDALKSKETKKRMSDIYFSGKSFDCADAGDYDKAYEKNNKIWKNYPFLDSIRKQNISTDTLPALNRDKTVFSPIYDKTKSRSFQNFVTNIQRDRGVKITNNIAPKYQWIAQWVYKKDRNKNIKLRYFMLDIEVLIDKGIDVQEARNPITLIQVNDSITNTNFILYHKEKEGLFEKEEGVQYTSCENEKELLIRFVELVNKYNPVCLAAWFGDGFDFMYIANRMRRLAEESPDDVFYNKQYKEDGREKLGKAWEYCSLLEKLSPYERVYRKRVISQGKKQFFFAPIGLYTIDYLDIYKKYSYGERDDYKLDTICIHELGIGKVEYLNVGTNLDEIYHKNFDLFMKYGVQDVKLLYALEQKIKYLDIAFLQAYSMGINVDDVLGTIYPWTHKLYNEYMMRGIALPEGIVEETEDVPFEGGHTFVIAGKKLKIAAYDVTSLYPKTEETYNISYETIIYPIDYDDYDKLRYLIIKYGFFDNYKEIIKKITQNRVLSERDFTFETYSEFFSLSSFRTTYMGFGDGKDPLKSLEVMLSKFINTNRSELQFLRDRLKVAAVVLSPMGCFFENEMMFDEKGIAKLLYILYPNINTSIISLEDGEFLKYKLNEYLSNIKADHVELARGRQKILEMFNEVQSSKNLPHAKSFNEIRAKIDSVKEVDRKRIIELFNATPISRKGVIPQVIAEIFSERKVAQIEEGKHAQILELITREKARRAELAKQPV